MKAAFAAAAIFLAAALGMATGHVLAHEWYPTECCSGHDCKPIEESRVVANSVGYVVDGRFVVAYGEARRSQDGRYHGCFPNPDYLRCLFVPPLGS